MVKESKPIPKPQSTSIFIHPVDETSYTHAYLHVPRANSSGSLTLNVTATIELDQFNDLWEIAKKINRVKIQFVVGVLLPSSDANGLNRTWDLDLFGNSVNPLRADSIHYMFDNILMWYPKTNVATAS